MNFGVFEESFYYIKLRKGKLLNFVVIKILFPLNENSQHWKSLHNSITSSDNKKWSNNYRILIKEIIWVNAQRFVEIIIVCGSDKRSPHMPTSCEFYFYDFTVNCPDERQLQLSKCGMAKILDTMRNFCRYSSLRWFNFMHFT